MTIDICLLFIQEVTAFDSTIQAQGKLSGNEMSLDALPGTPRGVLPSDLNPKSIKVHNEALPSQLDFLLTCYQIHSF